MWCLFEEWKIMNNKKYEPKPGDLVNMDELIEDALKRVSENSGKPIEEIRAMWNRIKDIPVSLVDVNDMNEPKGK